MSDTIEINDGAARRGLVVPHALAVASGKGGVGKTWLSVTLAHALARRARKVLLFDGDLGLANVDIQLGLMPANDLGQVFAGRLSLVQAVVTCAGTGFDVIAGRSGAGSLAMVPAGRLAGVIAALRDLAAGYDHTLLDLGAGVEQTVRMLAANAERVVVVVTDDPSALTDAYAFIKVASRDNENRRFAVVVNMAASRRDGERTFAILARACENFLHFKPPLLGVVRRDRRVGDAIRAQAPLLVRSPHGDAASDVDAIVEKLLAEAHP